MAGLSKSGGSYSKGGGYSKSPWGYSSSKLFPFGSTGYGYSGGYSRGSSSSSSYPVSRLGLGTPRRSGSRRIRTITYNPTWAATRPPTLLWMTKKARIFRDEDIEKLREIQSMLRGSRLDPAMLYAQSADPINARMRAMQENFQRSAARLGLGAGAVAEYTGQLGLRGGGELGQAAREAQTTASAFNADIANRLFGMEQQIQNLLRAGRVQRAIRKGRMGGLYATDLLREALGRYV